MANVIKVCPQCGNYVEGKRIQSKGGSTAAGAAIGSVVPGVGTLVGAGVGYLVGLAGKALVNDTIDSTIDAVTSEEYEFTCPRCGHTWTSNDTDYSVDVDVDDDDDDDDSNEEEFSFAISNVEQSGEYAAVLGLVLSGSISTGYDVVIQKHDGCKLTARVARIYDDDYCDGDFCNYVDSESSGCTLYLAGVKAWQIGSDDTIIIPAYVYEYEYGEEEEEEEDDDGNDDYSPERTRFLSFLKSFVDDEYVNMDVEEQAEMFKREGDLCGDDFSKYGYYLLAALARLEYFVDEWLENNFKNHLNEQEKLQNICLKKGLEEIQVCRDLSPKDKESEYVYGIILMLKEFWVDSCWRLDFCETWEQKLGGKSLDEEECLICPEYYINMFSSSLDRIKSYMKQTASGPSSDGLSTEEEEYLNEYKEMLADGEISDRDRRYLNKIMNANGISEARAKELEAMASSPSLTDEEQEYLNEYRDMISDGEISPRDQRFLDKLKKTNGISDARAKELEAMA